jgi:hypothetical protein
MRHYPGEVWFLPPEAEEGGDSKGRRHVLLTTCDAVDDVGIFSYASTRATEARFGAACLFVDPAADPSASTGFTRPSYVYASRLIPARSESLVRMTGRLIDEMPFLRQLLRQALGLGTGTAGGNRPTAAGWRGRVVRLGRVRAESIGYCYAIIVTEPTYSNRERYQIVVPVEDLDEFESGPGDLEVTHGEWIRAIAAWPRGALVAIADVQSVFHPSDVQGWTGAVVDETTMALIEAALIELFGL